MAQSTGPLVVVLLPGTNLTDWRRADAPTLHRLMETGALAVMNTRTARLPNDHARESPQSAALTLGAGSRAAGGSEATDFQPADTLLSLNVTAGQLYTRRMGLIAPRDSLVNTHWPHVLRANQDRGYDIRLGNLADGLAAHGVTVYAVGRMADAVACSGRGTVLPAAPDFDLTESALVAYDVGSDISTADQTLSNVVGRLSGTHGRLIVLSPSVSDPEYARGERLAPVVMWGEGTAPGLLYSPSTHQAGLVTNTDFAPTVAAYFGATPQGTWLPVKSFGGVWQARPAANAEMTVSKLEAQAYQQSRAMRLLPSLAIVLGVFILFGTAVSPGLKSRADAEKTARLRGRGMVTVGFPRLRRQAVRSSAAPDFNPGKRGVLLFFPAALVLSLLLCDSPLLFLACLALLMLLPFVVRGAHAKFIPAGMAAIAGVLVVDMCLGDPLMRHVMLGYSAVEGARYYGIGNEAMGALIGAALVVAAWAWRPGSRGRNGLVVCGLAAIALLLGSPLAGAKAGGLLVAVGSFGALLWKLRGGTLNARAVLIALGAAALALGMIALLDLHGGQQTHMGRAVSRILGGGWGEADDIIRRKLAVEGRLLYHSAWAVPLWGSMLGLTMLGRRRAEGNMQMQALWQAGWVAMALCLAVNDAGVVAAALCAALLWSGLMAAQTQNGPHRTEAKIASRDTGRE